jgi:hypothetical protein
MLQRVFVSYMGSATVRSTFGEPSSADAALCRRRHFDLMENVMRAQDHLDWGGIAKIVDVPASNQRRADAMTCLAIS